KPPRGCGDVVCGPMDKAVAAACLVSSSTRTKPWVPGGTFDHSSAGEMLGPRQSRPLRSTLSGILPPAEKVELVSSKRRPGDVCTWAQATTIMQAAIATHLIPVMMVITLRQWLVFVNAGWPDRGRGVSKG